MIGVIGGSGLYRLTALTAVRSLTLTTPYGEPSAPLQRGELNGVPLLFLPRHGDTHRLPPHAINYRANIHALRDAGATVMIAVSAVGGIAAECAPGALVLPQQIIDYTWGRAHTFYDGGGNAPPLRHIDFTTPYDAQLRQALLQAAAAEGIAVVGGGVYAATQGPRLESAAEIRKLAGDGATVVGMTGMPETGLACEAGLACAALCMVVNRAAGTGKDGADADATVCFDEIAACLSQGVATVSRLLAAAVPALHLLAEARPRRAQAGGVTP